MAARWGGAALATAALAAAGAAPALEVLAAAAAGRIDVLSES